MRTVDAMMARILEVHDASDGRGVKIVLRDIARGFGDGFSREVERAYQGHLVEIALQRQFAEIEPGRGGNG